MMRNLIEKLVSAVKGWGWIAGKQDVPQDIGWASDDFFTEHRRKTEKLAYLARYIDSARALAAERKAQKKRHSHLIAAIHQAQTERLEIETGRRTWSGLTWALRENGQ